MRWPTLIQSTFLLVLSASFCCHGGEPLFRDNFDQPALSDKWEIVGLSPEDYRIRDGGLEMRVQQNQRDKPTPMVKVNLPFTTADTVIASVDVTVIGEPLQRAEMAGLCFTDADGPSFTVRKTNIDGFFLFAPGDVDFIGQPGQEGDPGKYTVKYWPADKDAGALRIFIRGHYAHFQTGPSTDGQYRTYFHSAIQEAKAGLGFGLMASGRTDDSVRWVRFDNFHVEKP